MLANEDKIKVIIVEDESWVCRLIKKIVKWDELGFTIVGEAGNGNEAYELIKAVKPEVMITDIRMPGMDGISLIKKVKESGLELNSIIVSGHNDFEYAKEAIKYGAFAYLLKPIKRNEFLELLIRVKDKILKNREKVTEDKLIKNQLTYSRDQLKENYFLNVLIFGLQKKLNFNEANEQFKTKFREGYFQIIIYAIDRINSDYIEGKSYELELLEYIKQITQCHFSIQCYDIVILRHLNQIILLLNYDPAHKALIMNLIKTSFNKVNDIVRNYYVTIGVGNCVNDLTRLNETYKLASDAEKARVIYGINNIIDISDKVFSNSNINDLLPAKKEIKLSNFFETLDFASAAEYIKAIFKDIEEQKNIHPNLIFEVTYEIIEIFFKALRKVNIELETLDVSKKDVYEAVAYCQSIDAIINSLKNLIKEVQNNYNNSKIGQDRKLINVLKEYIHAHFNEDINLEDYAHLVYLSPKYLSELFKKETGFNITEYVIHYRIKIAKELLNDVQYKVNEVAEMVGYSDTKYFSKLFKKIVGVNPSEYKKVLQ